MFYKHLLFYLLRGVRRGSPGERLRKYIETKLQDPSLTGLCQLFYRRIMSVFEIWQNNEAVSRHCCVQSGSSKFLKIPLVNGFFYLCTIAHVGGYIK